MSHIICPTCKGFKKVQTEDGTWVPCEQCSAVGVVHQATGRCEGYVAPEPVEHAPDIDTELPDDTVFAPTTIQVPDETVSDEVAAAEATV